MKAWWLYWVEHLVADLHQPLHCATSCRYDRDGDAGGNRFPLTLPSPRPGGRGGWNLHAYWDTGIGNAWDAAGIVGGTPEERVCAATERWTTDPSLQPSAAALREGRPRRWVAEGARLAESVVYRGIQPGGAPDTAYRQAQADACKRLALLAGYRLAAYLNHALGR